jgi:hypothetical protein
MTTTSSFYRMEQQLTAVRVASKTNISGSYFNGSSNSGVGATLTTASSSIAIDAHVLENGDRVLLFGQTSTYQNGIYDVSGVGSAIVFTRSDDFQSIEQMKSGYYVTVWGGNEYRGSVFVVYGEDISAVGVGAILFFTGTPLAGVTANIGGGGAGPISVAVPGITSQGYNYVVATIASSSNTVAVAKCVLTSTGFNITFTADPGASCLVNYVITQ